MIDEQGKAAFTVFTFTTLPGLRSAQRDTDNSLLVRTGIQLISEREHQAQSEQLYERELLADERFQQAGIKSALCLPLWSKNGLLGNCILASQQLDAYSQENQGVLQQAAVQLAIGIGKSRLYELEKKANLEIERQHEERTKFVNSLVHEVKTPLTAMLASTELLREELSDDSSTLGALAENLDIAAHNLDRRISELMDFVKLQRTQTTLQRQSVDFYQIASQAVSQTRELLQKKHHLLKFEVSPHLDHVKADPERLAQILLNLLANATKFSAPHKEICLRTYTDNNQLIVALRDSAPPISPQEAQLIFTPYYQSKSKTGGGFGLGLSICKRLVELHGGRIWVETDGTGNQFKFSLPIEQAVGGKRGKK